MNNSLKLVPFLSKSYLLVFLISCLFFPAFSFSATSELHLSIYSNRVIEGNKISFSIWFSGAYPDSTDREVTVVYSPTDEFDSTAPQTLTIPANQKLDLEVETKNDYVIESNSSVTIQAIWNGQVLTEEVTVIDDDENQDFDNGIYYTQTNLIDSGTMNAGAEQEISLWFSNPSLLTFNKIDISVETQSPYIQIAPETNEIYNFSENLESCSFTLRSGDHTPSGEYILKITGSYENNSFLSYQDFQILNDSPLDYQIQNLKTDNFTVEPESIFPFRFIFTAIGNGYKQNLPQAKLFIQKSGEEKSEYFLTYIDIRENGDDVATHELTVPSEPGTYLVWGEVNTDTENKTVESDYSNNISASTIIIIPDNLVSISGYLKEEDGTPIEGADITFSDSSGIVTTDSNGFFTKKCSVDWNGTIKPSKDGYTFEPATLNFANLTQNQTDQNFSASPVSPTPVTDDLLVYLPFNGNVEDKSGNGNNGTLHGPILTEDRFGESNKAYQFNDIDEFIALNPFETTNSFTYSFWVQTSLEHEIDLESQTGSEGVFNQQYFIFPRFNFMDEQYWEERSGAGVSIGTNGVSVYEHSADYMPPLLVWEGSLEGWNHIAVTYDDRVPKLFVNGQLRRTGLKSNRSIVYGMSNIIDDVCRIGGGKYGQLKGNFDEFRFYDRALSYSEVKEIYNYEAVELDPNNDNNTEDSDGLLIHYTFEGDTVDKSGNGNDGMVEGAEPSIDRFGRKNGAFILDSPEASITSKMVEAIDTFGIVFWAKTTKEHEIDTESNSGTDGTKGQNYFIFPLDEFVDGASLVSISVGANGVSVYEHNGFYMPAVLVWESLLENWNHIAVVYEEKIPKLYINGEFKKEGLKSTQDYVRGQGSCIGGGYWGDLYGDIDEYRFYNRALTNSEIKQIYESEAVSQYVIDKPCLLFPENNASITDQSFQLKWQKSNGAIGYEIRIDTSKDFSSSNMQLLITEGEGNTDLTFDEFLPNGIYYWQVRSKLSSTYSNWSDTYSFTLDIDYELAISNDLVAFYPFNGNAKDESGNKNHGEVYGAILTKDRFNIAESAYYFDGINDYIEIQNNNSLNIKGSISITAWIKVETYPSLWNTILNKSHSDALDSFEITLNKSLNLFDFLLGLENSGRTGFHTAEGSLEIEKYHFISATYNGNVVNLYIDGKLNISYEGNNESIRETSDNLTIGVEVESSKTNFFNGVIDDIRIYNRKLSDTEIQFLFENSYTSGLSGKISDNTGLLLSGIQIILYSEAGNVLSETTTDENGSYHFNIENSGSYSIGVSEDENFYPKDSDENVIWEVEITDPNLTIEDIDFTQNSETPYVKIAFPRTGDKLKGDFGLFGTAFMAAGSDDDCKIDRLELRVNDGVTHIGTLLGGASDRIALSQVVWRDAATNQPAAITWEALLPDGYSTLQVAARNGQEVWGVSNKITVSKAVTDATVSIALPDGMSLPAPAPKENIALTGMIEGAEAVSLAWYVFRNVDGIEWDTKAMGDAIYTDTANYPREDVYPVCLAVIDADGNTLVDVNHMPFYRPAYKGDPKASKSGSMLGALGTNVVSGNFYYQTTDLTLNGIGQPFEFWRRYNSLSYKSESKQETSALGQGGWGHAYDYSIFLGKAGRRLYLALPDGHWERYVLVDGSWRSMVPGSSYVIRENDDYDGFEVIDKNQNILYFDYRYLSYSHGAVWKVTQLEDRNGNALSFSYNSDHRLAAITDTLPERRSINFSYNDDGFLTAINDGTGRSVEYAYDSEGYLNSFTDRRGKVWTYQYDIFGTKKLLTRIIDPRDNTLIANEYSDGELSWDGQWRVTAQIDAMQNRWEISYPTAQHTEIKNPAQKTSSYVIDASHMVTQVDNPEGGTTQKKYRDDITIETIALKSLVAEKQTPRFNGTDVKTLIGYDDSLLGNLTSLTDVEGRSYSLTWSEDAEENQSLLSAISIPGVNEQYEIQYDSNGNPVLITDPLGRVWVYAYNQRGQLIGQTDPLGHATAYVYDDEGYLHQIVPQPTAEFVEFKYDASGRVSQRKNARGFTTHYTYNENDQVTLVTDPYGNTRAMDYDSNGNLVSLTDKNGSQITLEYNAANLPQKMIRQDGTGKTYTSLFAYDGLLRLKEVTNARGNKSLTEYTATGSLAQQTDPLGRIKTFSYNADGDVSKIQWKNPQGEVVETVEYTRDKLGRVLTETRTLDSDAKLTKTYTYNDMGGLQTFTDAMGSRSEYTYDAVGRLTQVIQGITDTQAGIRSKIAYDESKNQWDYLRVIVTDPGDHQTVFFYDEKNRLVQKTDPADRTWAYAYDANGNQTTSTDPSGQIIHRSFDKLDRLILETYPDDTQVAYTYDANGNRKTMTDALGTTLYTYDGLNRMTSYTDIYGKTIGYSYDGQSNLTGLHYPLGKMVQYGYDEADQMTHVTDWLNNATSYSYDAMGRMVSILHANATQTKMDYDRAGRLYRYSNQWADGTPFSKYTFTLDKNGNPIGAEITAPLLPPLSLAEEETFSYDSADLLLSGPNASFTHDDNGNITGENRNGISIVYGYDVNHRLVSWTDGSDAEKYTYSGDGNRISEESNGNEIRYILDINTDLSRVLAATDGSGGIREYYIHGASGLIGRINADSSLYTYHFDATGNTIALSDTDQNLVNKYAYLPYGVAAKSETVDNSFEFAGQFGVMTQGNGLLFMRERFYHPGIKRFLSPDKIWGTIDEPLSLNLYAYVQGNPVMRLDPSGRNYISSISEELESADFSTQVLTSALGSASYRGYASSADFSQALPLTNASGNMRGMVKSAELSQGFKVANTAAQGIGAAMSVVNAASSTADAVNKIEAGQGSALGQTLDVGASIILDSAPNIIGTAAGVIDHVAGTEINDTMDKLQEAAFDPVARDIMTTRAVEQMDEEGTTKCAVYPEACGMNFLERSIWSIGRSLGH